MLSANGLAAQATRTEILSAGAAKSLMAAREAIRTNHWDVALNSIRQAQTVADRTNKDEYNIDALLAYVLYRQNKYAQAAEVYERLLESPLAPVAQMSDGTEAMAEMYYKLGNYPKAAKWAKTFLDLHPDELQMSELLGDAYFRMSDYKNAIAAMTAVVANAERERRIPRESWLRIIEDSYYRLSDIRGMESALVPLVRYLHQSQDWRALIDLCSQDVQDKSLAFGYHRLLFELNLLARADDYEAMVFEALDTRVPGEALQVLQRARIEDVFSGPDSVPGRYERLLKLVDKEVAADRASLSRFAAKATRATGGLDDVLAGERYLGYGQYDQAIDALNRGIDKGGVQDADEAHICLGIAYLKLDLKDLAKEAFRVVGKDSQWARLAELWRLHVDDETPVNWSVDSVAAFVRSVTH